MRKTMTCPKCGSRDIVVVPGRQGSAIFTGATVFSAVNVTRYLCGACGFCEEWVARSTDREKIKRKYGSARP